MKSLTKVQTVKKKFVFFFSNISLLVGIFDFVDVDFAPVYQCLHIHDVLNQRGEFQKYYEDNRRVWFPFLVFLLFF